MTRTPAVFGFPEVWADAYRAHPKIYHAIDRLTTLASEIVAATCDEKSCIVRVIAPLTQVTLAGMTDVILLTGNLRGIGAMKLARGMLESAIVAEYLAKNPAEADAYFDFVHIGTWKYLQVQERIIPGSVRSEDMTTARAEYDRVKDQFSSSKGRVRNNWSDKSVREMAREVGRLDHYDAIYIPASDLHHVSGLGLIAHESDWSSEALRVGHGALLQTVVALFNVGPTWSGEISQNLSARIAEFDSVWKEHAAARRRATAASQEAIDNGVASTGSDSDAIATSG